MVQKVDMHDGESIKIVEGLFFTYLIARSYITFCQIWNFPQCTIFEMLLIFYVHQWISG